MSQHFCVKCKNCQRIMAQCRCPDPNKTVTWDTCEDCKREGGVAVSTMVYANFPYLPKDCPGRIYRQTNHIGCSLCGTHAEVGGVNPSLLECRAVWESYIAAITPEFEDTATPYFNDPYSGE